MATNRVYEHGTQIPLDVSAVNGSGVGDLVQSDDPVAVGQIPGVALTDEDSAGVATVQTDGVFNLAVRGHNGTADTAISPGDIVSWVDAAGEVNVNPAGVRFGYALQPVAAGATTTIQVKVGY